MATTEEGVIFCVKANEGTFYTRDRAFIIPYLQKMWLNDVAIYEIRDGQIHTYLGNEKTYLNSLTD